MTDITELVKRMRGLAEYVDDCDAAADALEAQAKQIAELHKEVRLMDSEYKTAIACIAELEEALKPFADEKHIDGLPDWIEDDEVIGCNIQVRDLRAARAALNGEKV